MKPPIKKNNRQKLIEIKREQAWDNRFFLGKLDEDKRKTQTLPQNQFIIKRQSKKPLQREEFSNNMGQLQLLYQLWDQFQIPQFHRTYFQELTRQEDCLLREIQDLKINKAPVQMVMKIIKGREKCMNYLKSEFVESKNRNDAQLEQISELLCHLRILTINTIEYYVKWKQQLNQSVQWLFDGNWNYIQKLQVDFKFITEHDLFRQYFQFEFNDPLFVSIAKQAYMENTNYLKVHKCPLGLLKRVRQCEVVLLEENFFIQKNTIKIQRSASQETLKEVVIVQKSVKIFENVLLEKDKYKVCNKQSSQIEQEINNMIVDKDLRQSFKYNNEDLYFGYESFVVEIFDGDESMGMILTQVDNDCVNLRRRIINFVYGRQVNEFSIMIELLQEVLDKDGWSELVIKLWHLEIEDKLQEQKDIKLQLKQLGFRWKQQVNDKEGRYTIYIKKCLIEDMDIYDMEPICLKMGRAYIHSQEQSYDEIMDAYFELQQKNNAFYENNICNNLKNVNINGIKFKSINNEEEYEDFIKQGQQEYNMNINKKEQCQIQLVNICVRWQNFMMEKHKEEDHIRLSHQNQEIFLIQNNDHTIYCSYTSDPNILFFISQETNNFKDYIEDTLMNCEQKQILQQDLLFPIFTSSVTTFKNNIISQTHLSSYYHPIIHSFISNSPTIIITTPFIAGFIFNDVLESTGKPFYSTLITEKHLNKSNRTQNKSFTSNDITLQLLTSVDYQQLSQLLQSLYSQYTSPIYLKSFNHDIQSLCEDSHESTLLTIHSQSTQIGFAFISTDKNAFSARRWYIHTIQSTQQDLFESILQTIISFILSNDPFTQEIYINLHYYLDESDNFVSCKEFQNVIKSIGFKWKQQINDKQSRMVTFQKKFESDQTNFKEQLTLRACYAYQENLSKPEEEENKKKVQIIFVLIILALQIKMPPIASSNLQAFEDHFRQLISQNQEDLIISFVKMTQQRFPFTRTLRTTSHQELKSFLEQFKPFFQELEIIQTYGYCQFTNLQLRWLKSRPQGNFLEIDKEACFSTCYKDVQVYLIAVSDPSVILFFYESSDLDLEFLESEEKKEVDKNLLIPQFTVNVNSRSGNNFGHLLYSTEHSSQIANLLIRENETIKINHPFVTGNYLLPQIYLFQGILYEDIVLFKKLIEA